MLCGVGSGDPAGRRVVLALLVLALVWLASPGPARAEESAPGAAVRYGTPATLCSVTDPRLDQISGMATSRGALYVVNDTSPVTVWRLDGACRVTQRTQLRIPAARDPRATLRSFGPKAVDVEDLGATADGALWLADTGGNTGRRAVVSLYRWVPPGALDAALAGQVRKRDAPVANPVTRYDLRYPDGPHDVEALLVSLTGQAVLITKVRTGVAGVYAASLPLQPVSTLRRVGTLDLRPWLPGRPVPALAVTGGSVAQDGVHFIVRTRASALEWDAPDGDVVRALSTGVPRAVRLETTPQGEAITYTEGSHTLLTEGEQLPAALDAVPVVREPGPALVTGPVFPSEVLVGAAASLALTIGVGVLAWRRRGVPKLDGALTAGWGPTAAAESALVSTEPSLTR